MVDEFIKNQFKKTKCFQFYGLGVDRQRIWFVILNQDFLFHHLLSLENDVYVKYKILFIFINFGIFY